MASTASTGSHPALAFVASATPEAQLAAKRLSRFYGDIRPEDADVVVALVVGLPAADPPTTIVTDRVVVVRRVEESSTVDAEAGSVVMILHESTTK